MIAADYLRPRAVALGLITKNEPRRFGLHAFRHGLATHLTANNVDVKTVQRALRHSDAGTTMNLYAHDVPASQFAAQELVLKSFEKKDIQ